jgi:integrase/recombinase XerD
MPPPPAGLGSRLRRRGQTVPAAWPLAVVGHPLRHTTAMALLRVVDLAVIALWLGHESTDSTQVYLHADMTIKERALARLASPSSTHPGR